jgi:NAD+ synthase
MPDRLRIALAQLHPHLGDLAHNAAAIRAARAVATGEGADLLVTPQFSIAGFPPQELARDAGFVAACGAAIEALAAETADSGPGLILGGPWARPHGPPQDAAFLLDGGAVLARRARHVVAPEEARFFHPGPAPGPVAFRGIRIGLMTGRDWHGADVTETLLESGAELLVAIDAEPFAPGLPDHRIDRAVARVVESGLPLAVLGPCGGQDELVFDGGGFVLNADRSLALRLPPFDEVLRVTEWQRGADGWRCAPQPLPPTMPEPEQLWRAMMRGLADFVAAGGHRGVVLAPGGGLAAALTAACSLDALGAGRVQGVALSPEDGAADVADMLGIGLAKLEIGPAMAAMQAAIGADSPDLSERLGGLALQARAAAAGALLLGCAGKAETALGQSDPGGFSLVQDLWHRQLLELARWRNATLPARALGPVGPVIPERLLRAAPGDPVAEAVLEALIDRQASPRQVVASGFDRAEVLRVWHSLHRAEYKRRQSPPGLQLGRRAFGRDRRYPITHGFMSPVT